MDFTEIQEQIMKSSENLRKFEKLWTMPLSGSPESGGRAAAAAGSPGSGGRPTASESI